MVTDMTKQSRFPRTALHTLSYLWNGVKHILPQKIEGHVKFGMDDPCTTGQILGGLGIVYGIYGEYLTIEPEFNDSIFEAEVMLKGR